MTRDGQWVFLSNSLLMDWCKYWCGMRNDENKKNQWHWIKNCINSIISAAPSLDISGLFQVHWSTCCKGPAEPQFLAVSKEGTNHSQCVTWNGHFSTFLSNPKQIQTLWLFGTQKILLKSIEPGIFDGFFEGHFRLGHCQRYFRKQSQMLKSWMAGTEWRRSLQLSLAMVIVVAVIIVVTLGNGLYNYNHQNQSY